MKLRLILACTLLLLASVPLFALPECGECINNECVPSSSSGLPCTYDDLGRCKFYISNCTSFAPESVLTDWTVASIEISRPELDSEVVTTAADDAEVRAIELTAEN